MGNFLVIVSPSGLHSEAERLFRAGLEFARRVKAQVPNKIIETDWVRAASFARYNGSGSSIATDAETGCWLLTIGTWFHAGDYGTGAEFRLLSRYLEVGPTRLAQELEGFFVIVVGDARTQQVIVLTDIVGSCHCFVRSSGRFLAVSGSSLLLAGLGDISLDAVGCQEFLRTGIIYEDRTFYKEVRKLGPASIFTLSGGMVKERQRYWHIADLASGSLDGPSAVRALGGALVQTAQRISRQFEHLVCDLTGGYDSRALVATFLTAGIQFATVVSGPAESADVTISRQLAALTGLSHLHVAPQEGISFDNLQTAFRSTDGEYDLVDYARILKVHQFLSQRFSISLNGSFGEVARGYWWELLFPHAGARRKLDAQKLARLRYAAQGSDAALLPPETRLDLTSHFAEIIERTNDGLSTLPNTLQMDHAYLMMRMQRWQGRIASSTNQLWPCLSPFLFRSVLEIMLRTSPRFRRRGLLIRQMLTEYQPRVASFPLEHGYPAMPATWKTFFRFWPLPVYYGEKIVSKVFRKCGMEWPPSRSRFKGLPVRLQLWGEEQVQSLLRPPTMRVGRLLDINALDHFLKQSRQKAFPFSEQWARVLSLEYTLQVLEKEKVQLSNLM